MRSYLTLTPRGIAVLMLGIAGVWGATLIALPELAYIGCIFLAAVIAGALAIIIGVRYTNLTRTLSTDTLWVGAESTVTVQCEASSLLPTTLMTWTDALPDAIVGANVGAVPGLRSRFAVGSQRLTVRYPVTGLARGVHRIGPFTMTATDPLGLVRRHTRVGEDAPVTVAPAVVPLAALPNAIGEAGGSLHSTTSHLGEGSDNLIARPYAAGDSMRRIHWRATAHRDELMVRQEERESTPRAIVVFDRATARWSERARSTRGDDDAFETALSLCVSVAARLLHEGYLVHVVDQEGDELSAALTEDADVHALQHVFATLTTNGTPQLAGLRSLVPDGGAGPIIVFSHAVTADDVTGLASVAGVSTFPVLFASETAGDVLAACAGSGWRATGLAATGVAERDDAVSWAWLSALEQGASRVY